MSRGTPNSFHSYSVVRHRSNPILPHSYTSSLLYVNPRVPSAEKDEAEEDDEDLEFPSLALSDTDMGSGVQIGEEEEVETDTSIEDLRPIPSPSPIDLLSSRTISRQLSYSNLPDPSMLHSSYPLYNGISGLPIPGPSRMHFLSASPSVSVESVSMDYDEGEDHYLEDDIMEDSEVVDETEDDDGDLVNVKVKVEKKRFPTSAVKVTLTVQSASEQEDDIPTYFSKGSEDNELSDVDETSGESETSKSKSESEEDSAEDIEDSVGQGKRQPPKQRKLKPDSTGTRKEAETEGEMKDSQKIPEPKLERRVEEAEKMFELLDAAIQESEQTKEEIVKEVVIQNIQEAEMLAIAEAEKAAAQLLEAQRASGSASPLMKVKALGESVVSRVQSAISSVVGSESDKSSPKVSQSEQISAKLGDNIEQLQKDAKDSINKSAGNVEEIIEKSAEVAIETLSLKSKEMESQVIGETDTEQIPAPPPDAVVIANVTVHHPPDTVTSESPKVINQQQIPEPPTSKESMIATIESPAVENIKEAASSLSSQLVVPEQSTPSHTGTDMKDEYLSVYDAAVDSMDSLSSDDDDAILKKDKTKSKEETEEERKAIEQAKDRLIEEWKSTAQRESTEELDETFPHILEDMVNELHMDPVPPFLRRKLKEAVKDSEEDPNKASSAGSQKSKESVEIEPDGVLIFPILTPILSRHTPEPSEKEDSGNDKTISSEYSSSISGRTSGMSHGSRQSSTRATSKSDSAISRSTVATSSRMSSARSTMSSSSNASAATVVSATRSSNRSTGNRNQTPSASWKESVVTRKQSSSNSRKSTPNKNVSKEQPKTVIRKFPEFSQDRPRPTSTKSLRVPNTRSTQSKLRKTASSDELLHDHVAPVPLSVPQQDSSSAKVEPLQEVAATIKNIVESTETESSPPENGETSTDINSVPVPDSEVLMSPEMTVELSSILETPLDEVEGPLDIIDEEEIDVPNFYEDHQVGESEKEGSESEHEESPTTRRKWSNSVEIMSTLSHYLKLVKPETVEHSASEIIPLLTQTLVMARKTKNEYSLPTLIAAMSSVRVLCERLVHVRAVSGDKALKNIDLSWIIRILCKLVNDPNSKVRPEASFTLAKLVRASGPELITRPIYFLLVMENEGMGHKKGVQGSKTKAAALDTLTYALLTYPKEDFEDLEEISRWVCIVALHPHRRVRQAAMECIAVLGHHIGAPDAAVSRFRGYIVKEAELVYNRSDSEGSDGGGKKPAIKHLDAQGIFEVSLIEAISHRLRKHALPIPSPQGLIEYGVKIPTGEQLIKLLTKLQEEDEEIYEVSTSAESDHDSDSDGDLFGESDSSESIRMSDLEKAAKEEKSHLKKPKPPPTENEDDVKKILSPDVAYVIAGKGRVNKQITFTATNIDEDQFVEPEQPPEAQKQKEKKKKKLKKKLRQMERTYSEYEDDSPEGEDD